MILDATLATNATNATNATLTRPIGPDPNGVIHYESLGVTLNLYAFLAI